MARRTRGDVDLQQKKNVNERSIDSRQRKRKRTDTNTSRPTDPNIGWQPETSNGESGNTRNKVHMSKNNPMEKIRIANQHTASIIFPQSIPKKRGEIHNHPLPPITLPAGSVTEIDTEIWERLKEKTQMISRYLDAGLLLVVGPGKERVEASISRTSNPRPPEHLLSAKEGNVRIERENVSQVEI